MPDQSRSPESRLPASNHHSVTSHSHHQAVSDEKAAPAIPAPVIVDPATLMRDNILPAETSGPSRPPRSIFREYVLPILLLAVSLVTTTAIGARYMQNFLDGRPTVGGDNDLWPWPWLLQQQPNVHALLTRFSMGFPFSLTLLAILLTHEFGHYFACRAHRIRCTLPLVLPAPTLSGTAGAVIQIRGRIPTRHALLDVGIYGPLAGYAASLVAIAAGLHLSKLRPADPIPALLEFGQPLTLKLVHAALAAFHSTAPPFGDALRHPVLIAGWVGLFITALNLIPGGQLDGGHILYALSPRWHKYASRVLPFLLIACGFFFWVGWILWGVILWIPAMRHPAVPASAPVGPKRVVLAASALLIFALTLTAVPFAGNSILDLIRR